MFIVIKMGVDFIDHWTYAHFLWGVIATVAIWPSKPVYSLLIANIFHTVMEIMENDKDPTGKVLESKENHFGDSLAFFLGSMIGLFFTQYTVSNSVLRYILLVLVILAFIQEIGREVFP
jgi:hypothetical protein